MRELIEDAKIYKFLDMRKNKEEVLKEKIVDEEEEPLIINQTEDMFAVVSKISENRIE